MIDRLPVPPPAIGNAKTASRDDEQLGAATFGALVDAAELRSGNAEIFNEHGFFRAAQARSIVAENPKSSAPEQAALASSDPIDMHPLIDLGAQRSLPSSVSVNRADGDQDLGLRYILRALRPVVQVSENNNETAVALVCQEEPIGGGGSGAGVVEDIHFKRFRAPVARNTAIKVAIRDIDQGLQLCIAAGALASDERERLRDEIAALLSRHGLIAREVLIFARSPDLSIQEER